jgi:hypothetical protein
LENERQKNKLVYELELLRYFRAQEVARALAARGVKKIGKVKIADMELKGEYDYDEIMTFYEQLLRKEKEGIVESKKKKLEDANVWSRAIREEEKVAIIKYAQEHDDEEM